MNKLYCLIVMFVACRICDAQNLVPNGDFETHTNCTDASIDNALPWINPTGGTPDYLNQCYSGWGFGVPDNYFGYQFAHSGNAYAGEILYYEDALGLYREYIEAPLTSSLIAGTCYHFEMYFNLTEVYSRYTTTDVGVYFSNTLISAVPGHLPLPYTPQIINAAGNYPDTSGWTLVSGNYTALGGESYLIIGNFNDGLNPDTVLVDTSIFWLESYVFIDDVSLTPCTAIEEQNNNDEINIYPSPVNDKLNITINNNQLTEIILYDVASRKLMQQEFRNFVSLNTEQLAKGIYLYEVRNKYEVIKKGKVVKK